MLFVPKITLFSLESVATEPFLINFIQAFICAFFVKTKLTLKIASVSYKTEISVPQHHSRGGRISLGGWAGGKQTVTFLSFLLLFHSSPLRERTSS